MQVKLALCQLNVTEDKQQNIQTARQAIQVLVHRVQASPAISTQLTVLMV
jgi:hypothetical protein